MMLTKDRLLNEKEREAISSLISDGMSKTDVRWLNNLITKNESNLSGQTEQSNDSESTSNSLSVYLQTECKRLY